MGSKKPLKNHFSPIFTNEPWVDLDDHHYLCYERLNDGEVKPIPKGRKQWGQQRKLWSDATERALDAQLETPAAPIYKKLLEPDEPDTAERLKWAQFLRAQIVRTPTFMRYEKFCRERFGITEGPAHDRVGCEYCSDLTFVSGRRWLLLDAHDDDYFIRTDNPVFLTSFLWDPGAVLYYPLSPRRCFVATAMPSDWDSAAASASPKPTLYMKLDKGDAYRFNYYFAQRAERSIIMHPDAGDEISDAMFGDTVGACPQPPFDLHDPDQASVEECLESIRIIMSAADGVIYPPITFPDVPRWLDIGSRADNPEA